MTVIVPDLFPNADSGTKDVVVRLRVDGIDSLPFEITGLPPTISSQPKSDGGQTMSEQEWLDDNNRYLAASLQWLRFRLQAMIQVESAPVDTSPQPAAASGLFDRLRGITPPAPAKNNAALATEPKNNPAADPSSATRDEAAKTDPPPTLIQLAQNFGLSDFERDILLLCAAVELDPNMGTLCAAAQGNAARAYPTFALALQAIGGSELGRAISAPPFALSSIAGNQSAGRNAAHCRGASGRRARGQLHQGPECTRRTPDHATARKSPPTLPNWRRRSRLWPTRSSRTFTPPQATAAFPIVELLGVDVGSKRDVAADVCIALQRRLYRLNLDTLPTNKAEIENLARLWQRESTMLRVALYVDAEDLDGATNDIASGLQWFLSRDLGLVFVGSARTCRGSRSKQASHSK